MDNNTLEQQAGLRLSSSAVDVAAVVASSPRKRSRSDLEFAHQGQNGGAFAADELVAHATVVPAPPADASVDVAQALDIAGVRRNVVSPSVRALLGRWHHDLTPGQCHEDDTAEVVFVAEPDLHNNLMGALHPNGALYEKPVNIREASRQHAAFRAALRRHGVLCLTVRQVMLHDCDRSMTARIQLENLAQEVLQYELHATSTPTAPAPAPTSASKQQERARQLEGNGSGDAAAEEAEEGGGANGSQGSGAPVHEPSVEDKWFVGEQYKRQVLEEMSPEQLIDVILCRPTVEMRPSFRDTGYTATYRFEPLTNMQFTRDQQITTRRGLVMGRLRSVQRQHEVKLMRFCFSKLGLPVVGEIAAPGYLEGGDFFPAGPDLCLLGVGLRTNADAARQLMAGDMIGTRRLAVVRDDFEQSQDRMHLDCIFNLVGRSCCVLAEDVIGPHAKHRRLVDEYVRSDLAGLTDAVEEDGAPSSLPYVLARRGVEFGEFLRGEGYDIVPISRELQLAYGANILNLGKGNILACNEQAARVIARSKHFEGDLEVVDFGSITAMYGALHCSSQVLVRNRNAVSRPNPLPQAAP